MTQTATKRPVERVLDLLSDAKGPNEQGFYQARCPAHDDRQSSLSFKERGDGVYLTCYAFCTRPEILSALGLDEKTLHSDGTHAPKGSRLTLLDLSVDKLIPWQYLMQLGLIDIDHKGVKIPYYTMDGKPYERYRMRTHRIAKEGSTWDKEGSQAPTIPYGLQKVEEARQAKQLVIVEGESDCWTLWLHRFPALGIPGANNIGCLKSEHIAGIDCIHIIQEPGAAGQKFPFELKKRLDKIGYTGKAYSVDLQADFGVKDPNDLHKKDMKGFKANFEKAILHRTPLFVPGNESEKPTVFTLQDLMKKVIPPAKWVIPDILPEGLFLLTGKPKIGKSWLGFDMALSVAWGGTFMGKIQIEEKGEVLYLALEDNERRIQKRMGILLRLTDDKAPDGLHMSLTCPRIDKGGAEWIEEQVKAHPKLRLIIVDTWTKVSPRSTGKQQSLYESQYDALVPLKRLCDTYGIAIVAVHHNRKAASEDNDVLDEISGTTGLTGSVDGTLILKRERGQTDAVLHVYGRDIEEEQALAINFNASEARWILQGNAEDFAKTKERQQILNLLKNYPNGLTSRSIAEKLEKNLSTVRNLLSRLVDEGKIDLSSKYIYTLVHSERSEDSKSSDRSERSEDTGSTAQNTSQTHNEPHYGDTKPHYDMPKPHYGENNNGNHTKHRVEPIDDIPGNKPHYAHYDNYTSPHTEVMALKSYLLGERQVSTFWTLPINGWTNGMTKCDQVLERLDFLFNSGNPSWEYEAKTFIEKKLGVYHR